MQRVSAMWPAALAHRASRLGLPIALILLWQLASNAGLVSRTLLPAPSDVADTV